MNQLKLGTLLSYLQMIANVVIGLVYTPIMIRLLGQNEYGLYNTVVSTISMLSILSLGFNSGYIRYYAKYKKQKDTDSISRLNGLFLLIFSIIGLAGLFCGLFLTYHLDWVFVNGLTAQEYGIAWVLMLLLTVNLAVSFPMSVFQTIISAHEKFVFLKALGILKTVLGPLLTLPLLLMGYRSIAMVAVSVSVSIITDCCYLFYVKVKLGERFLFGRFQKGLFKELFIFTGFIALNLIIDQINWNIDKVLLGRFRGTAAVAVYSVGYSLYHYYMLVSTAVSGVFTPRIHMIYNQYKDTPEKMNQVFTDLFIRVGRIQFLILGLIASGVVFFGKEFICLWVGEGFSASYYVALLLILPSSIALIQNLGIEIQRAENKHQFRSIVYSLMAVMNLGLSIYLCQRYGPIGSAVGTAVSLIVANGLIMNVYYHRHCGIDILLFWKNMLRMSCGLAIPILAGIVMHRTLRFSSLPAFAAGVLTYALIYCLSVWLLSMNKEEKNAVYRLAARIKNKKSR